MWEGKSTCVKTYKLCEDLQTHDTKPEFTCCVACGDSDTIALTSRHAASNVSRTPSRTCPPGITMSHYTRRNMSRSTQAFSCSVFRLLAGICESVVFVYIGA